MSKAFKLKFLYMPMGSFYYHFTIYTRWLGNDTNCARFFYICSEFLKKTNNICCLFIRGWPGNETKSARNSLRKKNKQLPYVSSDTRMARE